MKFSRWPIFKLTALVGIVGIASLTLIHFIPTPPSKVVMAAGFKGASFEYYGRQYQEILARSHVQLELDCRSYRKPRTSAGSEGRRADRLCYWGPFRRKTCTWSAVIGARQ